MGRHEKSVVTETGIDRRETGYYSTPAFVARFLTEELLRLNPNGRKVFDPCAGREELLTYFHFAGKQVYAMDIEDFGVHRCAEFRQYDFLQFYREQQHKNGARTALELDFDYFIANPPYNCHETEYIRKNKESLQTAFGDIGSSNMYSMFISAIINLAKEGAVIGLITLDSFLTAGMHKNLREQILRDCSVHHLILCPTDLFRNQNADVRTCLLLLQKGKRFQGKVKVANRSLSTTQFQQLLEARSFREVDLSRMVLNTRPDNSEFVIDCPPEILRLFNHRRLGQSFQCVTGISTGNDRKYISKERTDRFTIPFFKNPGSRRFFTEADGYLPGDFLDIDREVKNFIVRNKHLLFKEGITCSSMGIPFAACYLPPDATYGVNANIIPASAADIWWLMAYLNSSLVTYFVRGVLIRTNMITSGYVSRIPIVPLSPEARGMLGDIAVQGYNQRVKGAEAQHLVQAIDKIVFAQCALDQETELKVHNFCANLLRST